MTDEEAEAALGKYCAQYHELPSYCQYLGFGSHVLILCDAKSFEQIWGLWDCHLWSTVLAENKEWIDREVGTGVTVVTCVCSIPDMKTEILTPTSS